MSQDLLNLEITEQAKIACSTLGPEERRLAMTLEMYQDAILTVDLPEHGLCKGDLGTVVERHVVPGREEGYSVEFFDITGRTVAVLTLPAHILRFPTSADRPSTRTLSSVGD